MNRYANTIILEFMSVENKEFLQKALNNYFNNPKVFRYLQEYLSINMDHFVDTIFQELAMSDPMPGVTILEQLTGFNNQFIQDRIAFITTHVIATDETTPRYMITDGLPTSRHGLSHYHKNGNDILKTWLVDSGRGLQSREDNAGDINPNNPYYGLGDNRMQTGIVFCDQRRIGTQNHVEQYENTSYKYNLNKPMYPHEEVVFGVSAPESDTRLMQRRIFRANEAGVTNGIPRYESRLYQRHYERDIRDGLHNAEKDCMIHGYDMSNIHRRIDYKQQVRAKYQPGCDQPMQSHLQNNNTKVPENMRYC